MNMKQLTAESYWGVIPNNWNLIPIRQGFSLIGSGTTPPTGQTEFFNGEVPWITTSELRENRILSSKQTVTNLAIEELSALKVFPKDTVLIAMYGATIGRVAILGIPACVNQAVCAFAKPTRFIPEFAAYTLQASKDFLLSLVSGGGQPNLNAEKITSHLVPCPPISQQRQIVDYLDRTTQSIDALIAAKKRLLELLAEKRRSMITQAVTRGLTADVPMKDSGVEWLGAIPQHWRALPLKFLCKSLQTGPFGSQLHAEDYIDNGIPSINPAHLSSGQIVPDFKVSVDQETCERLSVHKLQVGDIVFARRGEMGRCGLVTPSEVGWLCGSGSLRARPHQTMLNSEYLVLVMLNTFASKWLSLMSVGTTMDNLNTEIIGSLEIPVPSLKEQKEICEKLERMIVSVDQLSTAAQNTIALLQERRTSLISAAVTGQLQIPD